MAYNTQQHCGPLRPYNAQQPNPRAAPQRVGGAYNDYNQSYDSYDTYDRSQFAGPNTYPQEQYYEPPQGVRSRPPLQQQQPQRGYGAGPNGYPDSKARGPVRHPTPDGSRALADGRFQQQSFQQGYPDSRSRPTQTPVPYQSSDSRNGSYQEPQRYNEQPSRNVNGGTFRSQQQQQPPLRDFQDQGYSNGYQNGQPPPQDNGHRRGQPLANNPLPGLTRGVDPTNSPRPKNVLPGKSGTKERIFIGEEPDTIAWDNPFPTFPATKNKANATDARTLPDEMSDMTIGGGPRFKEPGIQRPQTADGPSSSRTGRPVQNGRPQMNGNAAHLDRNENGDMSGGWSNPRSFRVGQGEEEAFSFSERPTEARLPQNSQRNIQPAQYTKRFENPHSSPTSPIGTGFSMGPRSNTLPNEVSEYTAQPDPRVRQNQQPRQDSGSAAGYHGSGPNTRLPRQPPNISAAGQYRSHSDEISRDDGKLQAPIAPFTPYQAPQNQHESYFLDSYYGGPPDNPKPSQTQAQQFTSHSPAEEDMPNFDAAPQVNSNGRQDDILHLEQRQPNWTPPSSQRGPPDLRRERPDYSPSGSNFAGQAYRSRSSPNLREQQQGSGPQANGFTFGDFGNVPDVPAMPSQGINGSGNSGNRIGSQNGRSTPRSQRSPPNAQRPLGPSGGPQGPLQNGPYQRYGSPNSTRNFQRSNSGTKPVGSGPSPISRNGQYSPPAKKPPNPDALPEHPAPFRPGLVQNSVPSQQPKPAPVRQYNNPPAPGQSPQPPDPSRSSHDRQRPSAVSHEELDQLRQTVKANPSDMKTQLVLAKKMVEAAVTLADEGGRADQRTRNRNRERYVFDAHKLVKKLVSNGYPEAMFYLADCHGRGLLGLQPDNKEAFNLYQSAAKAGHPQAAYRVAVCCEMGQDDGGGTKKDPLKAVQWYKRAATLGDTPAMYKMGMIQLKGLLGQPKNDREALVWLKRAADRADEENPHALHELSLLYENAPPNSAIIRDPAYALSLLLQAASFNYKFSQFRLGQAYEYGLLTCPIDPRQSIAWYSKAAVQEEHQSELALSGWYLTGSDGVLQQSDTEAYLWARKAAQAGLAKAEYAMGYFTEVGIGSPADVEAAKRWYWRAAAQDFPKARERLEELRKGGKMMRKERVSRSAVHRQGEGDCMLM